MSIEAPIDFQTAVEALEISDPKDRIIVMKLFSAHFHRNTNSLCQNSDLEENIASHTSINLLEQILRNFGRADLVETLRELARLDYSQSLQRKRWRGEHD